MSENSAPKKVKALKITSSKEGFRRAGRAFGKEPTEIALDDLTKAEIKALKKEPVLNVSECEIEAPAE